MSLFVLLIQVDHFLFVVTGQMMTRMLGHHVFPHNLSTCAFREKLRFYHVPQTTKGSRSGWEEDDDHRTKQPVPPEALSSATSLLVYNTADNPYAGAQSRVDALDGGRKTAKRVQNSNVDEGKGALDAAPVR